MRSPWVRGFDCYAGNLAGQWVIYFAVTALCGIGAVLILLWAFSGVHGLGLDAAGTVALMLGIVVTSALGVALMALVFYSDRRNVDGDAHDTVVGSADGAKKSASTPLDKTPLS
jgi:hypothetical protein